jgi:NAD(P)-dependent dehydrogenase (short-subunit alcohol dehydrogenase family)
MSAQRGGRSASRVILLTGASGGIGRATAVRLADAGQVVFAAARRANVLEELAATHPGIHPVPLDVTDQASIDHARQQIMAETGGYGLDVLVNAAGILVLGPVEAVTDQQTRAQLEVNLFGTLAVTRAFLPPMRQRHGGRIVNVSSVLGRFALPGSGIYSASKFALEAASDALRLELAPFGVGVVLVQPGVIATPLYARAAAAMNGDDQALAPYRAVWPGGLGFPERLLRAAASVDGIAATLASAALAPNPRPRYRPGLRNRLNTRLLTALPTRSADRVKTWIAGGASSALPAAASPHGVTPPSRRAAAATRRAPTPRRQASEPVRRPKYERRRDGER